MVHLSPPASPPPRSLASHQAVFTAHRASERRAAAPVEHARASRAQRQTPAGRIRASQASTAQSWARGRPFAGARPTTAPSSFGSTSATSDSFGSSFTSATSLGTSVSSGASALEALVAPRPTPQLRHSTRGPASEPPSAPPSDAGSSVVGSPEPERRQLRAVEPASPPTRGRTASRDLLSRAGPNVRRYYCIVDAFQAFAADRGVEARPATEAPETRRELDPEVQQALERALQPLAQKQGYGSGPPAPR